MNQTSLASIIIPAWNGKDYIEACLNSLLAQDYSNFEVIVVDNASKDGSANLVAEKFPTVRLIRNGRNLGFAGGVNVGLRAAQGEVLILFNQDAMAKPGWLQALVSGLLVAPNIGVAGCKILKVNSFTLQHAGGYLSRPQALPGHFGIGQIDSGQYDQLLDVDFITGAAIAIRREVVEKIGYFDESFFFYFEDVDYCYRARAAGFRVVYVPTAVLHHHDKASLGAETLSYYSRFHTSRLQFALKHWGAPYFISQFQPAERLRLRSVTSPKERMGLRQAYQTMLEGVGWMGKDLSFDENAQVELIAALTHLRQQVYAAYPVDVLHPLDPPSSPSEALPERWWEVQEHTFVSTIPLVGPLIAGFRRLWNSISTKWSIRAILQQQNQVNRLLVEHLELQSQVLRMQGQILSDIDHDQTRLTTQLAEINYRLARIESRLIALEQKK
jgi:O-antigen biosynthesis protein